MASVSPRMRSGLYQQMVRMYASSEHDYPEFVSETEKLLPEEAVNHRFSFVVRRLWMNYAGEPPSTWKLSIAKRYRNFESEFEWGEDRDSWEGWIDTPLVEKTLSLWQARYPIRLSARGAVAMLSDTGRLLGSDGGPS